MATILVVDDEEAILDVLTYNLEREGHNVVAAEDPIAALARLDEITPDLIISDIMMPRMDGIEFCTRIRAREATALTPFLFVSARGQRRDKFEALKLGADDYITKPFDLDDLIARVNGRLVHRERVLALQRELVAVRGEWSTSEEPNDLRAIREREDELARAVVDGGFATYAPPPPNPEEIRRKVASYEQRFPELRRLRQTVLLGEHPSLLQVFESILIAASSDDPVLIIGETGTGKTGVAEAVAVLSGRASNPIRTMNCAELAAGDDTIALGRLFGYGKHSGLSNIPPTGRPGVLEEVDGGTLFLDEVGLLPPQAQRALLLPLEGRAFHPTVGSGQARAVDVKFVFATNVDLWQQAQRGEFPRDLYERIAAEVIVVPPLRERATDVPLLARHFLTEAAGSQARLGADAERALLSHDWPGNVRELRRSVRAAWRRASLDGRTEVRAKDLASLRGTSASGAHRALRQSGPLRAIDGATDFTEREWSEIEALRVHGFRVGEASDTLGLSRSSKTLSHRLRGMCFKALCLSQWDLDMAARRLGGNDPELVAIAARRLRDQTDKMSARLSADAGVHTRHLVADHREYALATLDYLRNLADPG